MCLVAAMRSTGYIRVFAFASMATVLLLALEKAHYTFQMDLVEDDVASKLVILLAILQAGMYGSFITKHTQTDI